MKIFILAIEKVFVSAPGKLTPLPLGRKSLFFMVPGFVLWGVLYCLLFAMARSKVGLGKYTVYLGIDGLQSQFPAGAGKRA